MSYEYGMKAIHLEMTDRVPRTEYSAASHWELVYKVTGIDARYQEELRSAASAAFKKAWNYDFDWTTALHKNAFHGKSTSMGHASFAANGEDLNYDISSYFKDEEDVFRFDPVKELGDVSEEYAVRFFNEAYDKKCKEFNDCVNMTGTYITCMSGLIDLFGWDLLLTCAGIDPEQFGYVTNRYCQWVLQYFKGLAKCKSEVIMVHDDIVWTEGAFIHPDWYRKYIFPNYKKLFQPLIESGKKIIYTSDGNYTEFIDDIVACQVNGFVMEPLTDMQYIADKYGKTHVFIGNADTSVLLLGDKESIEKEVMRCMNIGKKYPEFFMAVGNHIPSNTPVDNALWYNEFYEKYSKR